MHTNKYVRSLAQFVYNYFSCCSRCCLHLMQLKCVLTCYCCFTFYFVACLIHFHFSLFCFDRFVLCIHLEMTICKQNNAKRNDETDETESNQRRRHEKNNKTTKQQTSKFLLTKTSAE